MQIISPANTVYKGMIQGTMRIASGEGFLNLWRGMSSVVVGAGMTTILLLSRQVTPQSNTIALID
jgi:hypothetical protein